MPRDIDDLLVSDLMSHDVITVPADADLGTVAGTLAARRVHALFVLDDAGRPTGVITDFDLLAAEWLAADPEGFHTMRAVTAGDLKTSPVESIKVTATAAEAAARLRELHLSRLLVKDADSAAVGVISVSDLVMPLGRPSGARRFVGDVMSQAIVTCPPDSSLAAACRAMTERHSRSIVVVNGYGQAVGVITGSDLLKLYNAPSRNATVSELMKTPITCSSSLPLAQAAQIMIRNEVHRLVVVDPARPDGAPIGIISTSDIVAEMAYEQSVWRSAEN